MTYTKIYPAPVCAGCSSTLTEAGCGPIYPMTSFYMPPATEKPMFVIPRGTPKPEVRVMTFVHVYLQDIVVHRPIIKDGRKLFAVDLKDCNITQKGLEKSPYFQKVREHIRTQGWEVNFQLWPKRVQAAACDGWRLENVPAMVISAPA